MEILWKLVRKLDVTAEAVTRKAAGVRVMAQLMIEGPLFRAVRHSLLCFSRINRTFSAYLSQFLAFEFVIVVSSLFSLHVIFLIRIACGAINQGCNESIIISIFE